MHSCMHAFYSRLVSTDDNPLWNALRSLRRLDLHHLAFDEGNTWSSWDPTGDPPPDAVPQLVPDFA